jgi:hypothetical protein
MCLQNQAGKETNIGEEENHLSIFLHEDSNSSDIVGSYLDV